jgi:hypothetical protein
MIKLILILPCWIIVLFRRFNVYMDRLPSADFNYYLWAEHLNIEGRRHSETYREFKDRVLDKIRNPTK